MNEATEPTRCARVCARLLGIVQIVLLGPITLVSTITSSLLCCSCIVLKLQMEPVTVSAVQTYFSNCMSSWGIFWMIVLFFLPLALVGGCLVVALGFAAIVISYPCYATIRCATAAATTAFCYLLSICGMCVCFILYLSHLGCSVLRCLDSTATPCKYPLRFCYSTWVPGSIRAFYILICACCTLYVLLQYMI